MSSRTPVIEDKISNLETLLHTICSRKSDEIKLNNYRQCCEYIIRRVKYKDVCLGYLADKYELLTDVKLIDHKINKEILLIKLNIK